MSAPKDSLDGRVVVVTGASGRLGSLIIDEIDARGGLAVAIVREVPPGRKPNRSYGCDLTNEASVRAVFERISADFGRIDGLVHTVGMWAMTPLLDSDVSTWNRMLSVNLISSVLCFREAARVMRAGSGGGMVALTAGQGVDRGVAGQAAYSVAKGGLVRLVEAAADEWAEYGISVRAVAPSTILYGSDPPPGVPAAEVVDCCLRLVRPGSGEPSGTVVRAYGST